jgi:hypothetical protein
VADQREPRRRQVDPLLAVAREAARASLRGADYVVEGLSETGRRGTGRRSAGAAAGRQQAARAKAPRAGSRGYERTRSPGSEGASRPPVTGNAADLFVELLERFGEAVQDIAAAIAEREWFDGEPECPMLELQGPPGGSASVEFDFTNTGPSALAKVMFEATDLLGATKQIDASEVSFKYDEHEKEPSIPRVGPGGRARVIVAVKKIPDEAPAGPYRGVIAARSAAPKGRAEAEGGPEDAWAVIELEVGAVDAPAITPVERPREA